MKSQEYFGRLQLLLSELDFKAIDQLGQVIWSAYQKQRQIFFCGNGGSASTASHLAADIGKNVGIKIKSLALTDNVAWMTAVANDISYDNVFVEQLQNLAQRHDVLVVISGSGNSPNVVKAVDWANKHGLITVGILGFRGGKLLKKVRKAVVVRVDHYGYVEGIHSEIHHYLVEALKEKRKSG